MADRQRLARRAEHDLLVGDHPAHPDGVDPDAAGPAAPGPSAAPVLGRVRRPVDDAAAMRSTVSIAVPEGASTLASWCSSMISAVSNHGAASSAKRIIKMAPMAKLGR